MLKWPYLVIFQTANTMGQNYEYMKNHICELRSEELFEARSSQFYIRILCSCEKKAWIKFRFVRDSNPWPLRYRCSALPIKLTRQPGAGRWMVRYKPVKGWWWNYECIKNHICELRSEKLFEGRSSQLYTQLMQLRKESLMASQRSRVRILYKPEFFFRLSFRNCISCV